MSDTIFDPTMQSWAQAMRKIKHLETQLAETQAQVKAAEERVKMQIYKTGIANLDAESIRQIKERLFFENRD